MLWNLKVGFGGANVFDEDLSATGERLIANTEVEVKDTGVVDAVTGDRYVQVEADGHMVWVNSQDLMPVEESAA